MTSLDLDERIRRSMERITAPADPGGAFERVSRKRSRRRVVRRTQTAALAFGVIAVTSTATFILGRTFGSGRDVVTPTPDARPTFVPDIAFASVVEGRPGIYAVRADGTGLRLLTKDPGQRIDPSWSPDGTKLAYNSAKDGDSEIYVLDLATGEEHQVTHDPADDFSPAWSPDGTTLAFVSQRDNDSHIYLIDAEGDESEGSVALTLTSGGASDYDPAWSVDGSQIIFAHDPIDGVEHADLYVINVPSASLPEPPPPAPLIAGGASAYQPAESPDGTRVAFVSNRDDVSQIFVADATGSEVRQLTHGSTNKSNPSWSPDGQRIVFSAGDEKNDLFVMNADGTGLRQITEFSGDHVTPAWNPRASESSEPDGGAEDEAPCPGEDGPAHEPSIRKPGSLRGDVDGDGLADEVSVAVNPQATPECRYFLIVASSSGSTAAARIDPGVVGPDEDSLAVEALMQIDAEPGLEMVVDVWRGAATNFAMVFTMADGVPTLLTIEGFQPTEDTFAYGGSLSGLSGVDCTGEPGVLVLGRAFLEGEHLVVEREFLVLQGTVFRADPERTEQHRLSGEELDPPLEERFPEFDPVAFPTCAGAVRPDGS